MHRILPFFLAARSAIGLKIKIWHFGFFFIFLFLLQWSWISRDLVVRCETFYLLDTAKLVALFFGSWSCINWPVWRLAQYKCLERCLPKSQEKKMFTGGCREKQLMNKWSAQTRYIDIWQLHCTFKTCGLDFMMKKKIINSPFAHQSC